MEYLKRERKQIFYSILLGLAGGLVGVALFGLSGYMISLSFFDPPFFIIILIIAAIKLFGMMKGAFRYIERLLSHEATFHMIGRLRLNYFKKSLALEEDTHSVKFIQRLNQHFDQVENYYIRIIYPFITAALLSLILVLLAFYINVQVVLVMIAASLLLLFVIPKLFESLTYREAEKREETDAAFYMKLYHYIHDYTELFVTKRTEQNKQKMYGFLSRIKKSEDKNAMYESLMSWTANIIQLAVVILVIFIMYQETSLLVPMVMLLVLSYFDQVFPVMEPASNYRTVKNAVKELDTDKMQVEKETGISTEKNIDKIIINDLDYRYPGSKANVLKDINVTFDAGRKHAIIGSSGSGKTTLLNRIIEGDDSIRLYNNDGELEREAFINNASVMPQHLDFYNASIADNITMFGHIKTSVENIEKSLEEMQMAYYTPETMITHTGRLSGGEQKRLHFIRMMIEDNHWWVMDEPTARLDEALGEKVWNRVLDKETVIASTHDLSRLDEFDQIHYMERGEIIESGSYASLMAKKGPVYSAVERYADNL
ncbi:ATP-binding cassette domain-containing protein [Salinicoccus sp. HZC-1]|uniref:ATP-binding cassette domain-containing protein n=1 Tax=Salinicoccus sp. HZC-1 TaxID=3385497 RepID=UPI00398B4C8D